LVIVGVNRSRIRQPLPERKYVWPRCAFFESCDYHIRVTDVCVPLILEPCYSQKTALYNTILVVDVNSSDGCGLSTVFNNVLGYLDHCVLRHCSRTSWLR